MSKTLFQDEKGMLEKVESRNLDSGTVLTIEILNYIWGLGSDARNHPIDSVILSRMLVCFFYQLGVRVTEDDLAMDLAGSEHSKDVYFERFCDVVKKWFPTRLSIELVLSSRCDFSFQLPKPIISQTSNKATICNEKGGVKTFNTCRWRKSMRGKEAIIVPEQSKLQHHAADSELEISSVHGGKHFGTTYLDYEGLLWAYIESMRGTTFEIKHISMPQRVLSVTSGQSHTLALLEDTSVVCVGKNDYGQLGLGLGIGSSKVTEFTPVPNLIGIERIFCGHFTSFAITSSGSVWVCGDNSSGELGTGDTVPRSSFCEIVRNSSVISIAAKKGTTIFLLADGSTCICGIVESGVFVDRIDSSALVPVRIPQLEPVVSVILKEDGCHFVNESGQIIFLDVARTVVPAAEVKELPCQNYEGRGFLYLSVHNHLWLVEGIVAYQLPDEYSAECGRKPHSFKSARK